MDVAIIRWPLDRDWRDRLAAIGCPRLLLVDVGAPLPELDDMLEDWLRVPASDSDVQARRAALARRVQRFGLSVAVIDDDGVLRVGGAWVALPAVDQRLTRALLDRADGVVSRETLVAAGWPAGVGTASNLDVHLSRLRRRLESVGLAIRRVSSRGYLLEPAALADATAGRQGSNASDAW